MIQVSAPPNLRPGLRIPVRLTPFAPWRGEARPLTAQVSAPGLELVPAGEMTLPATVELRLPQNLATGAYPLEATGDCLPLKHWLVVGR